MYKAFLYCFPSKNLTTYFSLLSQKQASLAYVSPKLLMDLKKKAMNPRHDSFKSDVYAMGMLLLQAATL